MYIAPKVSKTVGEPSTSTNLKEALWEKIPVHHDLVRKFRHNFGPFVISEITVDNLYDGLSNVKTIVRETSEIDSKHGVMYHGKYIRIIYTIIIPSLIYQQHVSKIILAEYE